jgi:hypothetical protein
VTPPGLTGALDVGYVGCGAAAIEPDDPCPDAVPSVGHFSMPPDWLVNKPTVAKYVNRTAPIGGEVKVAVVKPSKVAKVVAKGLGEGPALDLAAAGKPGASGVIVILTVENESDGNTYRMCTRYAPDVVRFKVIAAGLGRKLVARGGLPVPCP